MSDCERLKCEGFEVKIKMFEVISAMFDQKIAA
jgi:hypothetical protein